MVSGDMNNHPVGHFLEGLLAQLDHTRIELIAYPASFKADRLTARIKPLFAAWKPLLGLSDEAAARLIHADGVHILLDLSGHTNYNRLPVFAWKPAPIQASWLGYFATTGMAEIDYLLADEVGVPEAQRKNFSETVWYLPDTRLCFTPPEFDLPVTSLPALTNANITFGCFQKLPKVGDEVLSAWGKILAALPGAQLRMQCKQLGDATVAAQFAERLQQHGIGPARVMLHGSAPRNTYLASHAEVDVILDTFPYPGGTTTCEALWMGVPTLTLAGDTLLARQGASLLAAAGLGDWVAASMADYIDKAVTLTSDLPKLAALRAGLREQVRVSPLFDAKRFARNLETALWGMWQARTQGNSHHKQMTASLD
jgi:predicted O-linked N-acetylglucosamine transferase (SPINDLY family)